MIKLFANMVKKNSKNNKQQFDVPFLFFCLGDFTFFLRSLFFLIIYTQKGEKQTIFNNNFGVIDIISNVLIFTFLLISCFIDYKKIKKNFIFFEKKCLSMYIASGLVYLFIFCFDILFTKILFRFDAKNNIFSDESNYKIYAIINFVFVTFFCLLDGTLQGLARKNMFNKKI